MLQPCADSSAKQNLLSRPAVRFCPNDMRPLRPHIQNMGRKRSDYISTAPGWDWYLNEWMAAQGVNQTQLRETAGWSKTAASEICTGKTGYSRRLVNEAANALNIRPFELLMPPEDAMALRRLREDALRVVETSKAIDRTGTGG